MSNSNRVSSSRKDKRGRKASEFQQSGTKSVSESNTSVNNNDVFMASSIGDLKWLKQCLKDDESKATKFDKSGVAAIHLCGLHGRLDCLKLLVERYGVDVNLTTSTGWTPLLLSINNQTGRNALKCVEFLLEFNANPSSRNEDGTTPAHQAAQEGQLECLRLIIGKGGVVNKKDAKGHYPVDLARIWGHKDCGRLLSSTEWKHHKDFFAHELHRLMLFKEYQEYLDKGREQDADERKRDDCDLAFKQWLDAKGYSLSDLRPHFQEAQKHVCHSARAGKQPNGKEESDSDQQPSNQNDLQEKSDRPRSKDETTSLPQKVENENDGDRKGPAENEQDVKERHKPKLPEKFIEEVLRPSKNSRSLVFKCDTILDVQQKRYGLPDSVGNQSQVGMLMCDYPDAEAIYPGFQKLLHPPPPSSPSSSTTTSSSNVSSINTERRKNIYSSLRRLHGVDPLLPMKGTEYGLYAG